MILLKEKADKDLQQHNAEMKELVRIIDHDRKLREFMNTKGSERQEDPQLVAWRQRKGRGRDLKKNKGEKLHLDLQNTDHLTTHLANLHISLLKMELAYTNAFLIIKYFPSPPSSEAMEAERKKASQTDSVESYEAAYERIKEITGEEDMTIIRDKFIQAEDQNFALFNYVNEQNNIIEMLQEQIGEVRNVFFPLFCFTSFMNVFLYSA